MYISEEIEKGKIPDFSNMSKEERKAEFRRRQYQQKSKSRKSSTSSVNQPGKRKQYSLEEQNEAWTDFGTSFSKKKKNNKKK